MTTEMDDTAREREGTEPGAPEKARRISVVIVSYFTGRALFECLESLLSQEGLFEIVLVNNGNSEETLFELGRLAAGDTRLRILSGHGNVGFAAGCNIGVSRAAGDVLLFLNPDCVLPRGALARSADLLRYRPDGWLVTARLVGPDGANQRGSRRNLPTPWTCVVEALRLDVLLPGLAAGRRVNLHETAPKRGLEMVQCCSGAYMMIEKGRYWDLGGFDDGYFLHVEDIDLCMAIHRQGGGIVYDADTTIVHRGGTSRASPAFVEWHKARGFLRYFYKHFKGRYWSIVLHLVAASVLLRFAIRTLVLSLLAPFRGDGNRPAVGIRN